MVRALLSGAKTQTRRVVKQQPKHWSHYIMPMWGTSPDGFEFGDKWTWREAGPDYPDSDDDDRLCPHGVPRDRLWVRETWRTWERPEDGVDGVLYRADGAFRRIEATREAADDWVVAHDNNKHGNTWRPSIFMPGWASRITLEITDVRVERLHDISAADARSEGVGTGRIPADEHGPERIGFMFGPDDGCSVLSPTEVGAFKKGWQEINGDESWSANPWVWVISFERLVSGDSGHQRLSR